MIQKLAPSPEPKTESAPVFQTRLFPESDVLIVSFSGLPGAKNQDRPFDFFMTTKMLDYSRILIRDPYDLFYLTGVDENGFDHFLERLRQEIKDIAPRKVIFIGASAGGYAAVLFGHLLGADYIHAFGTRGHFKLQKILRQGDIKSLINRLPTIFRLSLALKHQHRRFLDLKPLLQQPINPNPKTKTHLHACAYCVDASRARYLRESPNTRVFLYPCDQHNVAAVLLKSHCLHAMLQEENLDRAEEIYRDFYGDFDPEKTKAGAKTARNPEAILVPGGKSPDHAWRVLAIDQGREGTRAHLELRDHADSPLLHLGSSPLVAEARGHTLPINTEAAWNSDSSRFALKLRDSKNSCRTSLYQVADGAAEATKGPDLLEAVKLELKFPFTGRFYFESPVKWETPSRLLINVKGNTVNSIDPDGDYDYEYNALVNVESAEVVRMQEVKRALPPAA